MADSLILFTILGLIFGIYTILPETKKFRLGYALGPLEWCILGYSILAILILSLLSTYQSYHAQEAIISFLNLELQNRFIYDIGQFLIAIILVITIIIIFFKSNSVIHNFEYFREILEELWQNQRYTSFFTLIQENYDQIFYSSLADSHPILQYMDMMFADGQFVQIIVRHQPHLGLKIALDTSVDCDSKDSYRDAFIKELLRNRNSRLHYEIERAQSSQPGYSNRYQIGKYNDILYLLLSDIRVSKDISAWKPIGEGVIEVLDEQYEKECDEYNGYQQKFSIYKERCADPIFAGIAFFDLMVTEALYQKIPWHMWLYYYSHFVDKICRNYRNSRLSEPDYEFPNTYAMILAQIIHNLIDWIRIIEDDADKIECTLENSSCIPENGNIIWSSIICLSQCIRTIIISENIPDRLKRSYVDPCFRLYFDLCLNNNQTVRDYAVVLENCLITRHSGEEDYLKYKECLLECFEGFDVVPYELKKGGKAAIDSLYTLLQESRTTEYTF